MRTASRALAVAGATTLALATGIAGLAIGARLDPAPGALPAARPVPRSPPVSISPFSPQSWSATRLLPRAPGASGLPASADGTWFTPRSRSTARARS
jgi:hypothetical protein